MNVLVLHGPNLSLLGERPGDAPALTLEALDRQIADRARALGMTLKTLQSNHEGALVDALHAERQWADGVILNPGAFGATSYALRDAISGVELPCIEVHLHDPRKAPAKDAWQRKSVLEAVCEARIVGKGAGSYLLALERLAAGSKASKTIGKRKARGKVEVAAPAPKAAPTKTLGRRPAAPPPVPAPGASKTLGRARPVPESPSPAPLSDAPPKTLGRVSTPATAARATPRASQLGFLTRAVVRQKIAERLSGKLSAVGLATWARNQWQEVQRGAPAESGQRELLEDLLQALLLFPTQPLTDDQLIELMTRLDG